MSKSQFIVSRETFLSHYDKDMQSYYIQQNIDQKQLNHIKGNTQRWK